MHAEACRPLPEVRRELIEIILRLRSQSLDVVEGIERWRQGSGRAAAVWHLNTGEGNYLIKIKTDTLWLADSPLGEILGFSPKADPFFVVPGTSEKNATPQNLMTSTLQARRRYGGKKTCLPLTSALRKRIRKAELYILKESLQARMRERSMRPVEVPPPERLATPASKAACGHSQLPAEADVPGTTLTPDGFISALPWTAKLDGPADFQLTPVNVASADMRSKFEEYISRVDEQLAATLEPWSSLEALMADQGVEALEWFWLTRSVTQDRAQEKPDGLAIFKIKRMSTTIGQLMHLSVAGVPFPASDLEVAADAVKKKMFESLPIRSIRATLWHIPGESGLSIAKDVEAVFKNKGFKWFQLMNREGRRGQVMNCPRGTQDPTQPEETPSIQICIGQVWLRGSAVSCSTRRGFAQNSIVAALSLRHFWGRDNEAADPGSSGIPCAVREGARECLVRQLLTGELAKFLAGCTPVDTTLEDDMDKTLKPGFGDDPAALAVRLGRKLEASGSAVPGVHCEFSTDVPELVRRGSSAGFAVVSAGLGTESFPDVLGAMRPRDGVFGRLYVTLDWQGTSPLEDGFEVQVHAVGRCSIHPHPVFYIETSEDDTFGMIIPWARRTNREEALFATCTEILRATEPVDPTPYTAVQLSGFEVLQTLETTEIADPSRLSFADESKVHVAEFCSLRVSAGREMPGRLKQSSSLGKTYTMRKPFVFGLWHTGIDDLNAPLSMTLVQ